MGALKLDAKSFLKESSLSPLESIKNQVNRRATGFHTDISSALVGALNGAGVSAGGGIASVLGSRLDSISHAASGSLSGALGALGDGFQRISPSKLIESRMGLNGSKNSRSSNPESKIGAAMGETSGSSLLQYPPDLGKYFMRFELGKYSRPNAFASSNEDPFSPEITISLPIPHNLVDHHQVNLAATDLKTAFGSNALAYAAEKGIQGAQGVINDRTPNMSAEQIRNEIGKSSAEAVGLAARDGLSLLGSGYTGTLDQLVGGTPNPHLTVFFEGTNLRNHSFSWKFAPKNTNESILLKKIFKEFRGRMLPNKKFGDAAVLGYPNMVRLEFIPNSAELYKFKTCMIQEVAIDYAPAGMPSFFAGTTAPTLMEFKISLQEIEYFLREDFIEGSSGSFPGEGT